MYDTRQVRRNFSRYAHGYAAHANVQQEVAVKLADRVRARVTPGLRVLDAGAGPAVLCQTISNAQDVDWVLLDVSEPMCREARRIQPRAQIITADAAAIPLVAGSMNAALSSLMLQWVEEPEQALRELWRVVRPGGWLALAVLGAETLCELRQSWKEAGEQNRVSRFLPVEEWAAAMSRAGWEREELATERLVQWYPEVENIARSLRQVGAANARLDRPRQPTARGQWLAMAEAYEAFRCPEGLPVTWEVIFMVGRRK